MRRRAFVALCGGTLATTAGCLESPSSAEGGTAATSNRTGSTPTTTAGPRASVSLLSYQPGVLKRSTPETLGVFSDAETANAFFEVSLGASADSAGRLDFELRFDGETYRQETAPGRDVRVADGDQDRVPYNSGLDSGWLLYELPAAGDAAALRLSGPGTEWQPNETVRRRFATQGPDLAVDVDAPETIDPGDEPTISVTVRNDESVPGRFLATMDRNVPGESERGLGYESRLVPANEATTWEQTDTALDTESRLARREDGGPDSAVTYSVIVATPTASVSRDVRFEEA